jgi:hypothetical protein
MHGRRRTSAAIVPDPLTVPGAQVCRHDAGRSERITEDAMEDNKVRQLTEAELDHVTGGAPPDQGSGKNPSGNKVGPFAGNPHDRPGANAKETP